MNCLLATAAATQALITDPTWIFFVVLCIILFAPLLLRRLRIPHVVGLILAGILVGRYGFNLLERDSSFELFGQVGIYYIMFLAGLELDMGSVEKYGRQGLRFGLLTFVTPFVLGLVTSHHLLGYGWLTSTLLACIYSSHTLVSYPIVGRYGMSRHRDVVVTVVATAFAIFAALLVLALVVGAMRPETTWWTALSFLAGCVAYGVFVIMAYPRLGRWFLRRYDDSVMQFIFILALMFLSASLARLAGLEGLLGAFLAGLVVNRLIPKTSPLMTRLEFVGNALFIPYFLIGVGMLIDVRIMLSDMSTLWVVGVMVTTGCLSKLIPAALMAWWNGGNRHSMWLMFGLTNAHAAGALAIVMIGTAPGVGLMTDEMLNGTVMLILFSCIISSLATRHGAEQLALSDTTLEDNRGSYHGKCLITYSQQDNVDVMTQLAILIRNPYIPDSLMGLAIAYDDASDDGADRHRKGGQLLEQAQRIAAAADVPMATLNRLSTNVAGGILHTMKEYDCGEVIVCLTDRTTGMPKSSLGTTIDNVVGGSHREVMAVRSIVPPGTLRRVLVAVPEKAEYEVGFYKWLEHVCRIGEQLDCHLEFYAHAETMPYIRGYMQQKHGQVRSEYHEMNLWTQLLNLQSQTGPNSMLVVVTARPGFISYQPSFDNLPLQIHRYFGQTSVMLLYPDQWGDPLDSVSVFSPNGTAVTRTPRTLASWLRERLFVTRGVATALLALVAMSLGAQSVRWEKMSPLVRRAAMQEVARCRKTPAQAGRTGGETAGHKMSALVRAKSRAVLDAHGCRILHQWGDIYAVELPVGELRAMSLQPDIMRIEAGERCTAQMDTARIITRIDDLHQPPSGDTPYTGYGVVVGLMDIGFDLTHPTFYSRDLSDYRVRRFWDQLDYTGQGDEREPMYIGSEYCGREHVLAKAHSADGLVQYHGTHTAGTAAGSGYDSPFCGAAPEADICLVSNAVSSDMALIPDSLHEMYNTASDLLGFQYIFDYAQSQGKPCVISFSEGRHQDLWGEDVLAYAVLDSMTGPGRILCASAGNEAMNATYLHKPAQRDTARAMMLFTSTAAIYQLRSSDKTSFELTFFDRQMAFIDKVRITTDDLLAAPDSLLIDTLTMAGKQYLLGMTTYPCCYDSTQWATELLVQYLHKGYNNQTVGLTLSGVGTEVEAFSYSGYFQRRSSLQGWTDATSSHNVHFPASSRSVICVGATAWRTGITNDRGLWQEFDCGHAGERNHYSSVGPSLEGAVKPDVVAPGTNIISAMNHYYLQHNPDCWDADYVVRRFPFMSEEYTWNAQSGTSMATPIVAGIIALWLEAHPTLTRDEIMGAIAATSRLPDPSLAYPNNEYGYGEIDATRGLAFFDASTDAVPHVDSARATRRLYDLHGRPVEGRPVGRGIYIQRTERGEARKVLF